LAEDWPKSESWNPVTLTALNQCLRKLTENNREIVRLRYLEGRTGSDLARHFGRKLATIYQAISRIHKSLGECIRIRLVNTELGSHD
ncbi:MAG TPA: sigma factor-like helix-turn-helix DNA-binding protein, partial [Planctomicrobium sp.]|nr:sigma factor-like helix-turn-helix DNA-binding protein [Planctomicrobium sp.]